ncbi:MAG TPA: FtsX-like permease family protein, partial [Flavitalea sp.]|nr:FtsX-like permease family protein [Flavitalea sp.]
YNIQFIAGRPYKQSDTVVGFVVNEMLAKKLGFRNPENILGKKIDFWGGSAVAPIVGVIKDFNGNSLEKEIEPTVLGSLKQAYQLINIKIQPQNAKQTLATIEKLWHNTYPDFIFEHQFLNDKIAGFYKQENQLSQLYKIFACIAIFISCLGLYGFVSFMAAQRIKEVGVRKVLGASVMNIIYLFSKEFTFLIVIAFLIAAPVSWYFMHQWLQNFAYRINIDARIFMLTILISLVIAWLTVGYQSLKAALANPVNSLRTE